MRVLIVILIFVGIIALFFMANPLNRELVLGVDGVLISGEKFGIKINDDRAAASRRLEELGLKRVETRRDGICQGVEFGSGKFVDIFRDKSWRNGVICVVSDAGQVEAIGWFFLPVDL